MEDNARLEQFISWLSQTYFNGDTPEQIIKEIKTMQQSEEGQARLQQMAQEFQQATSALKRWKIDQLVEKERRLEKQKKELQFQKLKVKRRQTKNLKFLGRQIIHIKPQIRSAGILGSK